MPLKNSENLKDITLRRVYYNIFIKDAFLIFKYDFLRFFVFEKFRILYKVYSHIELKSYPPKMVLRCLLNEN